MCGGIRNIVILLLVMASTDLPVPWLHKHANLPPQELGQHIQQYHASADEWELPQGWHLHLFWFQTSDQKVSPTPMSQPAILGESVSGKFARQFQLAPRSNARTAQSARDSIRSASLMAAGPQIPHVEAAWQQAADQQLNVLLI